MLSAASKTFDWGVPMPEVAKVWRAGCIIRSDMLNDMAAALAEDPSRNLMLAPVFAAHLERTHGALRRVVAACSLAGLPVPALAAGLMWFDMMRTARGTANLIQAQRDYFGAHGFQRNDGLPGTHGPWGAARRPVSPDAVLSLQLEGPGQGGKHPAPAIFTPVVSRHVEFQRLDLLEHPGRFQRLHHFGLDRLVEVEDRDRVLPHAGSAQGEVRDVDAVLAHGHAQKADDPGTSSFVV